MTKQFTFRHIQIAIQSLGRGQYSIIGLSGKYKDIKVHSTDSISYDYCDDDEHKQKCKEARSSIYYVLKHAYDDYNIY